MTPTAMVLSLVWSLTPAGSFQDAHRLADSMPQTANASVVWAVAQTDREKEVERIETEREAQRWKKEQQAEEIRWAKAKKKTEDCLKSATDTTRCYDTLTVNVATSSTIAWSVTATAYIGYHGRWFVQYQAETLTAMAQPWDWEQINWDLTIRDHPEGLTFTGGGHDIVVLRYQMEAYRDCRANAMADGTWLKGSRCREVFDPPPVAPLATPGPDLRKIDWESVRR